MKKVSASSTKAPASAPDTPPPTSTVERVSFALRADGTVDTDGMRQGTRAKLSALLPQLNRDLSPGGEPSGVSLPVEFGAALSNLVQMLEYVVVHQITKAPRAVLDQVVPLTSTERAQLEPLLLRVTEKYTGGLILKYADECALLLVLVTATQAKCAAVAALTRQDRPLAKVVNMPAATPVPPSVIVTPDEIGKGPNA